MISSSPTDGHQVANMALHAPDDSLVFCYASTIRSDPLPGKQMVWDPVQEARDLGKPRQKVRHINIHIPFK